MNESYNIYANVDSLEFVLYIRNRIFKINHKSFNLFRGVSQDSDIRVSLLLCTDNNKFGIL